MTGYELRDTCKQRQDCTNCPAKKACDAWREKVRTLHTLEPWELDELLEKVTDLTEGDL